MRKIQRTPAPGPLRAGALTAQKRDLKRHFELPREVRQRRRAPLDRDRLLHPEVLGALRRMFADRCAYCESELRFAEDGLDHFRPVAGSRGNDRSYSPDHYGWFAYEWCNLLMVCSDCRRAKDNIFPLEGPRAPLLCSWTDAGRLENVQVIDPTVDDPLAHLALLYDGRLEHLTMKGEITIELLDLNRIGLLRERSDQIRRLESDLLMSSDVEAPWHQSLEDGDRDRIGVMLLFFRALCDQLPSYHRPSQRASFSFLRFLKGPVREVPREAWQTALSVYRNGDGRFARVRSYNATVRVDRAALWYRDDAGASARLRSISIRNFKGIHDLYLRFDTSGETSFQAPCAMLLGENATGKSTVLQSICLTLTAPTIRGRLKLDADAYLSREKSNWRLLDERELSVTVEMDDGASFNMSLDIDREMFVGPGAPSLLVLAYGARRYFTSSSSRSAYRIDSIITLFDPLATIRDSTAWLQQCSQEQFDAVARAMFEVLALERDDHIYRDDDGNVLVKAHGRDTPVSRMSDGYKALFAMAVDVMCRMVERWGNLESARGLVLIDEIETHLHPRWKMQVMGALRRSLPQVQFVTTTHDPLCLRGMRNGEIHVLFRSEDGDVNELQDLPGVQGLRAEQLLTSDYFGLASTSDPEFERLIEDYSSMSTEAEPGARRLNERLRSDIGRQLSEMTIVGSEASEQIVAEAVARYLSGRRDATVIDRRTLREDAVRAVLDVLRASRP